MKRYVLAFLALTIAVAVVLWLVASRPLSRPSTSSLSPGKQNVNPIQEGKRDWPHTASIDHPPERPPDEPRWGAITNRLAKAVATKTLWKEEVGLLLELEDLLFKAEEGAEIRRFLLGFLADAGNDPNLAGVLAFVLTAHSDERGRQDLVRLLGRNQGNDAALAWALTIRHSRIESARAMREQFWKGCLNALENDGLLKTGFRSRLFKDDYGRTLADIAVVECVKPSAADAFERENNRVFHELRKNRFNRWIDEKDQAYSPLLEYLAGGPSMDARGQICSLLAPSSALAAACGNAFKSSSSASDQIRLRLLNCVDVDSPSTWDALNVLLPFAGEMNSDILARMLSRTGGLNDRQDTTLALIAAALDRSSLTPDSLKNVVHSVAQLQTERSEAVLLRLCREHVDPKVRAEAVVNLVPQETIDLTSPMFIRRVACAQQSLLSDNASEVTAAAAKILSWMVAQGAQLNQRSEVRTRVDQLISSGVLKREWVRNLVE